MAKRLHYGQHLDPARDWILLLAFAGVAFAGILVWNIWTFRIVAQGGTIGAPPAVSPPIVNRSALDTIHSILANRTAEETKYRSGVYTFSDPSR